MSASSENRLPKGTPPGEPGPSTLAVHAGEARQKPVHSLTDPIVCAATYTFANTQAVIDYIEQKQDREEYGRYGNPGEKVVERKLAALEGGEDAVLYASGMAAIVGLLMTRLNSGDEVVFFDEGHSNKAAGNILEEQRRILAFLRRHLLPWGPPARRAAPSPCSPWSG